MNTYEYKIYTYNKLLYVNEWGLMWFICLSLLGMWVKLANHEIFCSEIGDWCDHPRILHGKLRIQKWFQVFLIPISNLFIAIRLWGLLPSFAVIVSGFKAIHVSVHGRRLLCESRTSRSKQNETLFHEAVVPQNHCNKKGSRSQNKSTYKKCPTLRCFFFKWPHCDTILTSALTYKLEIHWYGTYISTFY